MRALLWCACVYVHICLQLRTGMRMQQTEHVQPRARISPTPPSSISKAHQCSNLKLLLIMVVAAVASWLLLLLLTGQVPEGRS